MKNITKLPKFMPGQVIDLSHKHNGLPNRLLVKSVFMGENDNSWMYDVYAENIGERTVLNEGSIISNMTHRSAQVYSIFEIVKLYNDGWRFCGNFNEDSVRNLAAKIALDRHIKHVITKRAYNYRGCRIDGVRGVWIKYNFSINDDGTIIDNSAVSDDDTVVIK